jgi:hypothetical protein
MTALKFMAEQICHAHFLFLRLFLSQLMVASADAISSFWADSVQPAINFN